MKSKIADILSNFVPNDKVKYFINSNNINYWEKALTHDSINYKYNYEKYEFLGDSFIGYSFSKYLYFDLEIKSPEILNNLLTYYMSKAYQPKIAQNMGIVDLAIISPKVDITPSIKEDLFESFFGIFSNIGRQLHKKRPETFKEPLEYGRDFFKWYFSKFDKIDTSAGENIKNNFIHYYFFFSKENPLKKISGYYNTKTKRYFSKPEFINGIKNYSPKLASEILSNLKMEKDTEMEHFKDAMKIFRKHGFDKEWFEREKERINFDENVSELAKRNGFNRFILNKNSIKGYDLLAQKQDPLTRESISEVLMSFDGSDSFFDIKNESLKILYENYE